jgi:DNA-binding NarL/FixJ family response regulator
MRVLLADDEAKVVSALRLLLEQQPNMAIAGEAPDSAHVLAQVAAARPDLVLIDWELPGMPARDLIRALLKQAPGMLVIALSGRPEARAAAIKAGAIAFVSKGDPPETVLATLCGAAGAC